MTLHLQQKGCSCGGDCRNWSLGDTPRSLRYDVGLREEQYFMGWGGRGRTVQLDKLTKQWSGHWRLGRATGIEFLFDFQFTFKHSKVVFLACQNSQKQSLSEAPISVKCGLIALRETLMENSPALKPPSSTASHLCRINCMCRKWVLCNYMGKNDAGRGGIPLSKHKHYKLWTICRKRVQIWKFLKPSQMGWLREKCQHSWILQI